MFDILFDGLTEVLLCQRSHDGYSNCASNNDFVREVFYFHLSFLPDGLLGLYRLL